MNHLKCDLNYVLTVRPSVNDYLGQFYISILIVFVCAFFNLLSYLCIAFMYLYLSNYALCHFCVFKCVFDHVAVSYSDCVQYNCP